MLRNILLADDHVIIRRGLRALIDNHFGKSNWIEADRAGDIIDLIAQHHITHAVLDMQLLDANLLDILPEIRKKHPALPIMVYTMSSEEIFGPKLMNIGIQAFVSKQLEESEVINAFRFFFNGKNYFSAQLDELMKHPETNKTNPIASLSERELSVLNYLLLGKSVKEICEIMQLKVTTVATYKARVFDKLGVSNLIELQKVADIHNYEAS
jgi:two-component system invasion response regulator UvrY